MTCSPRSVKIRFSTSAISLWSQFATTTGSSVFFFFAILIFNQRRVFPAFKDNQRSPFRLHLIKLFHGILFLLVGDGHVRLHGGKERVPGPLGYGVRADVLEKFSEDGLYPGRTPSSEIFPDETDRVFYEISLSVEDAYVVTNNVKHFPKVTRVVTPSEMLMLLHESGEI